VSLARRLALVVATLLACAGPASADAAAPAGTIGVFRGATNYEAIRSWEGWLGSPAHRVLDYLAREDWSKIATPYWWVGRWQSSAYRDRLVYSVPMLPDNEGTLAEGATGAYNPHFASLARMLVAGGQGSSTIRLGWEFNGSWYRWSAVRDPTSFAAYWREIVRAMRSVPGARFTFDWSPNLGPNSMNPERAWPGDAYVDYVGADVYDHGWQAGYKEPARRWQELMNEPYGLRWHRDFARAHRKRMTFPEWGLVLRGDGHGGGDDPYFVQRMHDWIAANDVAYAIYFEVDSGAPIRLMTGHFPRAAACFRRLFGPTPVPGRSAQLRPPAAFGSAPPKIKPARRKHGKRNGKPRTARCARIRGRHRRTRCICAARSRAAKRRCAAKARARAKAGARKRVRAGAASCSPKRCRGFRPLPAGRPLL
jgi:glycosyl hydrolase family 26